MTKEQIKQKYDITEYVQPEIIIPEKPKEGLVLIVGSSGSGKTTIIKSWFNKEEVVFNTKNLIDNFSSIEKGESCLLACGLRSIPTWFRSYYSLSTGEAHRAYCAKIIDMNMIYIDEFTSVVDRNTAKSLSTSLKKYYDKKKELLVIATCHRDVEDWLQPDLVYDTDAKIYRPRGSLQRPKIKLVIYPCAVKDWVYFKDHHYLSSSIANSCHCYIGLFNGEPVTFSAVIHGTGRDIISYWRESRLVVKPEFQGLGIGKAMSEGVAEIYFNAGKRFFSKTAHPALGEYRNNSIKWRGTSTNQKARPSYIKKNGSARVHKGFGKTKEQIMRDAYRVCYSHEYVSENKI